MKNLCFAALLLTGLLWADDLKKNKTEDKAQDPVYQIVITANRAPQSSREIGSSLSILPGNPFGSGSADLIARLAAVPGLSYTRSGGFGQPAGVFIRGANSEHTLVLVDGVEVNDPSSTSRSFNFGELDMNQVERVEVLRGAQSPLYGSDAIGGVVQIVTHTPPSDGLSLNLCAETGRYRSFREHLSVSGRSDKAAFNLGLNRFDSQGFSAAAAAYGNSEADGIARNQLNLRGDLDPSAALRLGLNVRYSQADLDLDGSAGLNGDDPNYTADNRHLLLSASADWQTRPDSWKQTFRLSHQYIRRRYDDPVDKLHPSDSSRGDYRAQVSKLNWQNQIGLSANADLVAGIEWQRERAESTYSYSSAWGDDNSDFPQASASTLSAYGSFNLDLSRRLFINAGLRFDQHEEFGAQLSAKFSPAWFITTSTKLMGSISNGFKAPSLYQLFAPATVWGAVGNQELEPETAVTMDFGLQQSFWDHRLSIELSAFFNRYRNLIDYDYSAGYINIRKARSRGLEASLSCRPGSRLNFTASYTYTNAVDEDSDLELLRRPKHRLNLNAAWQALDRLSLCVELSRVGQRQDIYPYPERMTCKAYTLMSAGCEWKPLRLLKLFFRLENIGDVEYESVAGYGSPRRSAFIGAQLEIQD